MPGRIDQSPKKWSTAVRRLFKSLLCIAMLALPVSAVAQTTASLDGLVSDPSGAVVPGAKVKATNVATQNVRITQTNEAGVFSFSGLPSGDYQIDIDAPGFHTADFRGIHLDPGDQRSLRGIKLAIGVTETITVVDVSSGQLQTDSGETSALISAEDIQHLAVQGRDVTELLKILPGMSIVPSTSSFTNAAYDPSIVNFTGAIGSYSANGTQTNATALLVDGMDVTDPGSYGLAIQNVNYDQVAEVKVRTGSFAADTAHGPVVINALGKSGGTAFHGSLYTYARTNQLNSIDWIAKYSNQPRPQDRQIYPGFTIGGPVLIPGTDFNHGRKLTFFAGMEEYAQRKVYAYNSASSATVSALVPTLAMRNGDFSATQIAAMLGSNYKPTTPNGTCSGAFSNLCTVPKNALGGQVINNGNLSSYIDPLSRLIFNRLPQPNVASNGAYNFITTDFVNNNLLQLKTRVDYALSERTHLFISYGYETGKQYQPASPYGRSGPNGMGGGLDIPGGGFAGTVASHVATFHVTSVLSPTLTNEFYVGGAYFAQPFQLRDPSATLGNPYQFLYANGSQAQPSFQTYGSATYNGLPFMSIEDSTFGPTFTKKQLRMAGDDVSKVVRSHTLRAGIFYQWISNPQKQQGQNTNGSISDYYHPSTYTDADGSKVTNTSNYLADILLGSFGSIGQTNSKIETSLYFYGLSGYVQDHWLLNRHLSVDAGIRFEHLAPWTDPHGIGVAVFDPASYANKTPSRLPGVLYHQIDSNTPIGGVPTRAAFISPRLGFAWDPRGDTKTIIRGGFGVYRQHDSYNDIYTSAATAQGQRSYSTAASGHTFAKLNLLQPTVGSATSFANDTSINVRWKPDDEAPRVHTYNLAVDQRLPHHMAMEFGYVGNAADHLMESSSLRNINAVDIGTLYGPQPNAGRADTASTVGTVFPFFTPAGTSANNTSLQNLDTAHVDSFRPYPLYQNIYAARHRGYSYYNALQVLFGFNSKKGRFNTNYTLGKALGAVTGPDPIHIDNDYMPLSIDRRHILNFSYSYSLGNLVQERILGLITNGWEISGITNFQGGSNLPNQISTNFALTATLTVPVGTAATVNGRTSRCATTTGTGTCSVGVGSTLILGSPDFTLQPTVSGSAQGSGDHQYVNGSAFRLPTIGINGPSNLGNLRGPAFFNSDLSMSKTFHTFHENTLQFRMAAFNFLNRANYTFSSLYPGSYSLNFNQSVSSADMNQALANATNQATSFGSTKIRTGRRILEMSVKYQF